MLLLAIQVRTNDSSKRVSFEPRGESSAYGLLGLARLSRRLSAISEFVRGVGGTSREGGG